MFLGVGLGGGAYALGLILLLAHGFFKAGLFLGAGSVMHGMNDQTDIRRFGGLWKYMKYTWVTFGLGYLAIIGFPPLSGFFAKDPIISAAFNRPGWTGWLFGFAALIGAGLTAFYMTRLFVLTFHGPKRWTSDIKHPHESPWIMTVPLMILAVGSVCAGFLMKSSVVTWLTPVFGDAPEPHEHISEGWVTAMTLASGAGGNGLRLRAVPQRHGAGGGAGRTGGHRGSRQPLRRHGQRGGLREARSLPDPGSGVLRQPGDRRCGQRAGRPGRRWLRPPAPRTQTGFVRTYALSMLGGALLVVAAMLAVAFG